MLIKYLDSDFSFKDERGQLEQLVHEGYKQINVVYSGKDVFRGDHYHKENNEAFFVVYGSFKFKAYKDGVEEEYVFKKGDFFEVAPYVIHSFYYTEESCVVAMYDIGVERADGTKDIYAVEE